MNRRRTEDDAKTKKEDLSVIEATKTEEAPARGREESPEDGQRGEVCSLAPPREQKAKTRRGVWWVAGSFLLCPCHLPVTLMVLSVVLGGTALGAALQEHAILAGSVVTVAWGAGTWRGIRHLRAARSCTTCETG